MVMSLLSEHDHLLLHTGKESQMNSASPPDIPINFNVGPILWPGLAWLGPAWPGPARQPRLTLDAAAAGCRNSCELNSPDAINIIIIIIIVIIINISLYIYCTIFLFVSRDN